MAKLGQYTKSNGGTFELMEEKWHLVRLADCKIIEAKKYQSEETETKLQSVFETINETNSYGDPFKMFYFPRLEVNPHNEKSRLYKLLIGLFGEIPENIDDLDIEKDLVGKKTKILTTNTENHNTGKTYTEIIKFQYVNNNNAKSNVKKQKEQNVFSQATTLKQAQAIPTEEEIEQMNEYKEHIIPAENEFDIEEVPF